MAKAIASGDERLMKKAGLEADIARLDRLRAAHEDDQFAVRRQIRDAERDIAIATSRIGEIGQDLDRRWPTQGEAFGLNVGEEQFTERKPAGRALMKEILTLVQLRQEGKNVIASIGGFDLEFSGRRFGGDGYRYETMLIRTGAKYELDLGLTVTPLGAVAKLEHALGSFEEERRGYESRLRDAERRLASYRSRSGESFAFAEDLTAKRRELGEGEKALATEAIKPSELQAVAA